MKIVLIYAKSQAIREMAKELFSDTAKTKGELARDEIYPPLGISLLGASLAPSFVPEGFEDDPQFVRGKELFDHAFHRIEGVGAPEMNADSCRACHQDVADVVRRHLFADTDSQPAKDVVVGRRKKLSKQESLKTRGR